MPSPFLWLLVLMRKQGFGIYCAALKAPPTGNCSAPTGFYSETVVLSGLVVIRAATQSRRLRAFSSSRSVAGFSRWARRSKLGLVVILGISLSLCGDQPPKGGNTLSR